MISWNVNLKKIKFYNFRWFLLSRHQIKEDSPGAMKVMARLLTNVTYPVLR
jgi:hypothetical protein